jgi:hypothetical protein
MIEIECIPVKIDLHNSKSFFSHYKHMNNQRGFKITDSKSYLSTVLMLTHLPKARDR